MNTIYLSYYNISVDHIRQHGKQRVGQPCYSQCDTAFHFDLGLYSLVSSSSIIQVICYWVMDELAASANTEHYLMIYLLQFVLLEM